MLKYIYIFLFSTGLYADIITPNLEYLRVSGVGYSWQSVNLGNSYSDPIIVCTNVLPNKTNNEAVVRIRNITSGSFQVKIQRPNDSNPGYSTDVYCIVSDEGSYTIPFKYEAHKVLSNNTNGNTSPNNWSAARAEEVTGSVTQSYTKPAVLGQVMSFNDNRFSVFWSFNCQNRSRRPFQSNSRICVGKQVGQVGQTRNNETLGYMVAEAGIYELEDFSMAVNYGSDSIRGIGNNPPYSYTLDKSYTHGVVHQEAEDGGQGGWAVLYGATPFGTSLDMGIDEETVQGDTTRTHTTEEVAYWVMLSDPVTPAKMNINEVLYRQTSGNVDEFVEFYVTQGGNLKNYLFSDQDGTGDQYRFPKHSVNTGDYVILHIGSGTDSVTGNVHHFYLGRGSNILNNNGDDIVLYKPVNTDVTVVDGNSLSVVPIDYMTYGSGGDGIPTSQLGITLSWTGSENSRLSGAATGESIALTPNANDSDTSLCWELSATTVASKKATNCTNYIPTRDTNTNAGQTNSITLSNTATPNMNIIKSSIVTADGINASNPKRIPGATIRYCFTVDNTGGGNADNVKVTDSLTGNGKDNLTYVKSGKVIQDIATACDCATLSDSSGSISGTDVTINIGTLTGTTATTTSRSCAYIEMTIQ
ncbi:MAG TPA: lamin tail domain-containing protein [Epsilonproteobacteria bacterium]|nr:lamin tail domain-containing protein [Campylobacterota bacterium]